MGLDRSCSLETELHHTIIDGEQSLAMVQSFDATSAEEARIRAAYESREQADTRYSWFNPAYQLMVQQRERRLLALLRRYGFAASRVENNTRSGLRHGPMAAGLLKWGARPENMTGIDLLADRVSRARQLCPLACAYNARARRSFLSLPKALILFFNRLCLPRYWTRT